MLKTFLSFSFGLIIGNCLNELSVFVEHPLYLSRIRRWPQLLCRTG